MSSFRIAIALSALLCTAPLAAEKGEEQSIRKKSNGEFLFKHYPSRALAAGEQGKVKFRVTQDREGNLASCEVIESSGYASLDNETCELITRYGHFNRYRTDEGKGVAAVHDGFVNWKLPARYASRAKAAAPTRTASATPDKIICTREVRTGSLAGAERRCMTRRDRALASDRAKDTLGRIQGKGSAWDGQ